MLSHLFDKVCCKCMVVIRARNIAWVSEDNIAFTYRVNIVINEGSQDGFKEVREDNKSIRHCFYIPC